MKPTNKTKEHTMSEEDLETLLIKVVGDSCRLYRRNTADDFIYTQFVVLYTLYELGLEHTIIPDCLSSHIAKLKRNVAEESLISMNCANIPKDNNNLRMLLHKLRDIEFFET